MVLLCTYPRGRWFPSRVVWDSFFLSLFVIYHFIILLGFISLPKLCLPHTKRLSVLLVLLLFVLKVGMAHIAHHVEETVTDIAVRRKKVHQGSTDHNSLALVGVLLGNSWAVPMQLKMWGVNVIHYCKFLHEFHRGNGNAVICSHDTRKTRSRQLI